MRRTAVVVLLCLSAIAACGDDDTDGEEVAQWCSTFDDYAVLVQEVTQDPNTPPADLSDADALDLEERVESLLDNVPDPIEEDWELALPQGVATPEELHRPERVAAQVRTYEWIVENCELSTEIEAELRSEIAADQDVLDDHPTTQPTTT